MLAAGTCDNGCEQVYDGHSKIIWKMVMFLGAAYDQSENFSSVSSVKGFCFEAIDCHPWPDGESVVQEIQCSQNVLGVSTDTWQLKE